MGWEAVCFIKWTCFHLHSCSIQVDALRQCSLECRQPGGSCIQPSAKHLQLHACNGSTLLLDAVHSELLQFDAYDSPPGFSGAHCEMSRSWCETYQAIPEGC
jgi:hypothetical protein